MAAAMAPLARRAKAGKNFWVKVFVFVMAGHSASKPRVNALYVPAMTIKTKTGP